MTKKKISLIIPCLNEENGLDKLLKKVPKFVSQVLIVDGDSTDRTVEIAKKHKADVIIEPQRGYGLALRRGFDGASGESIVTMDGDGTYPVDEISKMHDYFVKNNLDFLVACRFPLKNRNAMTVNNFFGNLLISATTSLFFNYQVNDVCSGMWMMSKKSWEKLNPKIKDNRWFFSNEIKIEALLNKSIVYDEYWIELQDRLGKTKVGNVWLIGLKVLFLTAKKRFFASRIN